MLLKRVLKHKTSFICYFEFHDLYLFTFSRLKSLPCPSSTRFAGQLAHVIGPLKCYNDDYQCYDYQCYPRFTLISAFYPLIRVLLSYPCFTLSSVRTSVQTSVRASVRTSVRTSVRPSICPSIRPSIRPSVHPFVRPYPRFTLTPVKTSPRFTAPGESFAMEFVKICRYKTFRMRIFERTTFLQFRCCSIHVKLCVLATYSA